jgi:hypothetical protein
MTFGGEVHHVIGVVVLHKPGNTLGVANVSLHEDVARVALNRTQILAIARIGERIHVHNANVVVLAQHIQHEIRADKSGTASNQIGLQNQTPCRGPAEPPSPQWKR